MKSIEGRVSRKTRSSTSLPRKQGGIGNVRQDGTDSRLEFLAGPIPATRTYQVHAGVLPRSGATVRYARNCRRITLERYLISKWVWHPEMVTFPELLVLYDNLLWCQDKCQKDPGFKNKFGVFLENITELFKKVRFHQDSYASTVKRIVAQIKVAAENHLIPARNLPTVERHVKGKFHVIATRSTGVPNRELPPVKVIGRGYRDKGTYRDPAWDGSPSWQDVATYFANLERDEEDQSHSR